MAMAQYSPQSAAVRVATKHKQSFEHSCSDLANSQRMHFLEDSILVNWGLQVYLLGKV